MMEVLLRCGGVVAAGGPGLPAALLSLAGLFWLLLLSQLSPGPDIFFVFRTALSQGFRAGAAVGCGIAAGFLIQATLVASMGTWLVEQPWLDYVVLASVVWLLYLACRIFPWRGRAQVKAEMLEATRRESMLVLLGQGLLCNILNPKCTLFICGLSLGPLKMFGPHEAWYAPALVLVLSSACLLGWVAWSALLQWKPVRGFYLRHTTGIDALFAFLLAVFAVLLGVHV